MHVEMERIAEVMQGKQLHDLETDWKLEHTVTRCFEILGESSAKVSKDLQKQYPDLPWKDMKEFRNRIIHNYFDINYKIVYDVITKHLPELNAKMEEIKSQSKGFGSGKSSDDVIDLLPQINQEKGKGRGI